MGYILSIIVISFAILIGFLYWYFTEKYKKGWGTTISQYEPPQRLRPAMAELICKEKITEKAWPATIVDLAVRGYVRIKEDKPDWLRSLIKLLPYKEYIIEKIKDFENDFSLEDYERDFLNTLFSKSDYFSTKELKKKKENQRKLFEAIQKLKEKLYEETELDTRVFEKRVSQEKTRKTIITALIFSLIFLLWLLEKLLDVNVFQFFLSPLKILIVSIFCSALGLMLFIKYEARLSKEGVILKED